MDDLFKTALLFVIGSFAGFINVMAGGGSSLTLPLLIFLGLDSSLANGTNRVAIFLQNVSAVASFKQEKYHDFKMSARLALFTLPGAIAGTFIAVRIESEIFQKILGLVLIGIIITTILPAKNTFHKTSGKSRKNWIVYLSMLGIGFYGGFIQVGVGFLCMAALKYALQTNLVKVNMHKVFIVLFYTIPSLLIFALTKNVNWLYGLILATGNAFGAWQSAKISIQRGEKFIRIALIFSIFLISLKLLGVFEFLYGK